jgi:adenine-specific DNA-methyltransferase
MFEGWALSELTYAEFQQFLKEANEEGTRLDYKQEWDPAKAARAVWRDGKPVSREGTSHIFKYLKLESYEDTLNNVSLIRNAGQQGLVESDEAVREEYMLSYMLDNEAAGSAAFLTSEAFEEPFAYRLKVNDGNEMRLVNVDMVETFNYLLGLTVDRVAFDDGFRTVQGNNPQGERVLVIWRNLGERSNADLDKFFVR